MDSRNPGELITEVKEEQQTRGELATEALQWFLDGNVGELFPRGDVVDRLSNELDITNRQANTALSDTVGDIVDPIQQISTRGTKYVGVIDYRVYSSEGAYGYVDFDDKKQERKRVVCAKCVENADYDEEVVHATQGEGTSSLDASWQDLLNKVTSHYTQDHTEPPKTIEPGASLVDGTTISGNTAIHGGNQADFQVTDFGTGGADGEVPIASGGALTMGAVGGGFEQMDVFESDGTFDASDVDLSFVEVVGGGGGGGGSPDDGDSALGGGGGGYSAAYVDLSGKSSVSISVGSGGSGGGTQTAGSNGGTSSFGSFLSATGGGGGSYSTAFADATNEPGRGGGGSGGDINVGGGGGGSPALDINDPYSGSGGDSVLGGGAVSAVNSNGFDGELYGGGGSGGSNNNVGGDGADGAVIVSY